MSLKDEMLKAQKEKQTQKGIPQSDATNKKRSLNIGAGMKSTYEKRNVGRPVNEGAGIEIQVDEESDVD